MIDLHPWRAQRAQIAQIAQRAQKAQFSKRFCPPFLPHRPFHLTKGLALFGRRRWPPRGGFNKSAASLRMARRVRPACGFCYPRRGSFMLSPPFRWTPALRRPEKNISKTFYIDPKNCSLVRLFLKYFWKKCFFSFKNLQTWTSKTLLLSTNPLRSLPKWHFEPVHYTQHLGEVGFDPYTIRGTLEGRWNVGVNSMDLRFCLKSFQKNMFCYRSKIATAIHTLHATHLSFQTRSIHYTRNMGQIFQNTAYSD